MLTVIADSSALVSLVKKNDSRHGEAMNERRFLNNRPINAILPAEVFAEAMNVIGKKISNPAAIEAAHAFVDAGFTIVHSEPAMLLEAADRLAKHKASVSFVDSLVMVWADYYDTRTIFGFDAAFAASGYLLPRAGVDNADPTAEK